MKDVDFSPELVLFHPAAAAREDLLRLAAATLLAQGYVRPSFEEALLERERNYPTGLPMEEINAAIPHADAKHVERSSILVCIMKDDVFFRNMADVEEELPVRIVFVLALADAKKHLSLLQELMTCLQDAKLTRSLLEASDGTAVFDIVQSRIFAAMAT